MSRRKGSFTSHYSFANFLAAVPRPIVRVCRGYIIMVTFIFVVFERHSLFFFSHLTHACTYQILFLLFVLCTVYVLVRIAVCNMFYYISMFFPHSGSAGGSRLTGGLGPGVFPPPLGVSALGRPHRVG